MRFTLIVTALVGMAAFANADQPSPGTYLIVNRVASPTGQRLAATLEGGQTKFVRKTALPKLHTIRSKSSNQIKSNITECNQV